MDLNRWEKCFEVKLKEQPSKSCSHDLLHIKRVVSTAKHLAAAENADLSVVLPSAWLHDFVDVEKGDARRSQASTLSARLATEYLQKAGYPEHLLPRSFHCIQAHSFSAAITPRSLEAEVVQDADRLDAIGAIGIARCLSTGAELKQAFYQEQDPFAQSRPLDEGRYTVDHSYQKSLRIAAAIRTRSARAEADRRHEYLKQYLSQLRS